MSNRVTSNENRPAELIEGEDFYWERDRMVFTAAYHVKRGYCCDSGCRHCPYKSSLKESGAASKKESRG